MSRLKVDIISQETIKPSSPTPPHLRFLKQSIIDQHEPALFIPMLVFFAPNSDIKSRDAVLHLKKSLPEMLTLFYPLAGRVRDNQFIDCNDQGIHLFETRVNARVQQVLDSPLAEELVGLLPRDDSSGSGPQKLLSIQINVFDCGGIVLATCMSHKIADGSSLAFFINTWASRTRGDVFVAPRFGTAPFFPPKETSVPHITAPQFGTQVKQVSKWFVFSAANIAALRAKCSTESYTATRVEAVTAFIWSCKIKAAKTKSSALMPAMNLRTRMDPPLHHSHFGNIMLGLLMTVTANDDTSPDGWVPSGSMVKDSAVVPRVEPSNLAHTNILHLSADGTIPDLECLAKGLRRANTRVDASYTKRLRDNDGVTVLYDSYREVIDQLSSKGEVSYFGITSCCRFPFYEADFGWGRPEWVTFPELNCENITFLTDTKCGTGIEARTTLSEELMSRFERECKPHLIDFDIIRNRGILSAL